MTRIGDETVNSFDHGRASSVGTTAAALTSNSTHAAKGVQLKAAAANTAVVYVGNSDVTADSADATDGFPLQSSDSLFLPINDPSKIFVIASAANQKVFFLIV